MGTLLQVNGMEVMFGLRDVIYLIGILMSGVVGFLTLKSNVKSLSDNFKSKEEAFDKDIKLLEKDISLLHEDIIHAKSGRKSIRDELQTMIKERDEVVQKRIDKTQDESKVDREKNSQEFAKINETISGVKQDTSEIKGMITTLLNKP